MTIDEAIKNLSNPPSQQDPSGVNDFFEAVKLGIEALKAVKDTRKLPGMAGWRPLPGETKE